MKISVLVTPILFAVVVYGEDSTLLSFGGSQAVVNEFSSSFSCSGKLKGISEFTIFVGNDTCNGFRNGTQDINFSLTFADSSIGGFHLENAQDLEACINGNVMRHFSATITHGSCAGGIIKRTEVLLVPNQDLCATTGRNQTNSIFAQIEITGGPCAALCNGTVQMTSTALIQSTLQ